MIVIPKVSPFVLGLVVLVAALSERAQAGAFLLEPGHWQVISTMRLSASRLKYDGSGRPQPEPLYRKTETSTLIEYGLNRDVTLMMVPTGRHVAMEGPPAAEAWNIGSLDLGARWRVHDFGATVVSFQGLFRVPARSDPAFLPENRWRSELLLGLGRSGLSWLGRDGFADFGLAWVKREDPWPDEVRADVTLGWWQFSDQLMLMQWFQTFYPNAPGQMRTPSQTKFEASTVSKLGRGWSLQLGSFASIGGVSTRYERGTIIGLWRKF